MFKNSQDTSDTSDLETKLKEQFDISVFEVWSSILYYFVFLKIRSMLFPQWALDKWLLDNKYLFSVI